MSPLDETLKHIDLVGLRCTVSRRPGTAVINRDEGMQVVVRDADDRHVEVLYEQALHDTAREECEPQAAAAFVRAVLSRTHLEHVPLARG